MFKVSIHEGESLDEAEVRAGESLLDELLSAGREISYSCKRGDCGQCAAALLAGTVTAIDSSHPSHEGEDILLCNVAAESDLTLGLPYFPELESIKSLKSPAKIHELNRLGEEILEVVLRLPPTQRFDYLPGQFIRLTNKAKVTRSYSLAAPPAADKMLRLHVRKVPGGVFSDYLFDEAHEGDLLHLEGPQGHFFLRDNDLAPKTIFLATGTGIAPIKAMLEGMTEPQRRALGELFVYWGNRHRSDAYVEAQLQTLSETKGFTFVPVFSQQPEYAGVRHVQDAMTEQHADLSGALVFACGNPAMIEAARETCQSYGLPRERFRSDPFTSS